MEQIIYKFEQFEGPLDLLLNLLAKNKMTIEEIKIAVICDQYMKYIETMQYYNIELSAEFIVTASQLMLIKSRKLLPRQNEDEKDEDEEELKMALREYERAKEASSKLGSLYTLYNGRMEKDTDEIPADRSYVADHDVNLLSAALMRILSTFEETDEIATEKIKPLISTKTISVGERVFSILRTLINNGGRVNVIECFNNVMTKHGAVATFMALLEMLKAGRIMIEETEIGVEDEDGVINLNNDVYIILFTGKIRNQIEG
ncbi:MAG: segregation/condensation protein A [Clostridia bacterium]|nr:segregation/condensation protein A [Clostridia bacterium]